MWNPDQYARFAAERRQPFDDLLALVEKHPRMRVADLGCGTGELTRRLHEHLGASETIGVDNSETMLLKSTSFGSEMVQFESGDIAAFIADRPFDLIFSNAALHWVPDHEGLLHRLTSFLSPTGQLAIQMPANNVHPSHRIAAAVAAEFGLEPRPDFLLAPEAYAALLHHLGYKRQHVRLEVYGHLLDRSHDVVDWVRGALLNEYEKQLVPARWEEFLAEYTSRLAAALGESRPYFYTYNRLLLWGSF